MKSLLLILIIFISTLKNVDSKTYYVSPSGGNTNSGLTLTLAWKTLTYAASSSSPVAAGDTVYVKSGSYGAEKIIFQKSGTSAKPIVFLGYKTAPGDAPPLIVNNTNPYAGFLSTDMPLFDGGNRTSGIGFDCRKQKYLIIKNFQIQNYAYGLITGNTTQDAGNLTLYNINAMALGDVNASYSGEGFLLGSMGTQFSNNNTLINCMVVNSGAEGFDINGNNNVLTGCKVYCNENIANAPTDYYMIVTGNYNTFTSCYIERTPGLSHAGHGYTAKTNAEQVVDQAQTLPAISSQYNKFYYCIAKNMGESFCVRHRTAQYNLFYHCKAIGTHTGANGSSGGEGNCIVTRDGASDNTFDGCIAENCNSGFVFVDTVEDGDTGTSPPGHPGKNNRYMNCLIYNCYMGVEFDNYGVPSDAGDNTIANCTFYKTRYLHYAARHCANMKYIGNIYYGCLPAASGGDFKEGTYNTDILPNGTTTYFKNCDFVNIEGGMPTNFVANASGSITADPLFVNPGTLDFHLQSTSPCKDACPLGNITTDFDSLSRSTGTAADIGAFEYQEISPTILSVTLSSINVKCNGGNDGSATVRASGGKIPYTYLWSNGQTTASCIGLIAGSYTVTVSDAAASSKMLTVAITQPLVNVNSITSISNVSTYGGNNGTIVIVSEGGTPAYTYLWLSTNQTTATATGLSAGNQILRVTDANGCVATRTIVITQPNSPTVVATVSSTNVKCNGGNDGSATVTASGGKTPYTYLWSNGKTTSSISGVSTGSYTITITDAIPSSKIYTVTITEPQVNVNSVTSISNVSSTGGSDGKIAIYSEGGTPAYSYLWVPSNQTTNIATGLSAGGYFLKVTDANGCIATRTLTVTEPGSTSFSAKISSVNIKCNGGNDGSAIVAASGGKAPYTYLWSNGQKTSSCSGLGAGNYSVTVSDATPLSKTLTVAITQPLVNVNSIASISNVSSYGGSDGKIIMVSEGGTPAYTYLWSPTNQTTPTATGLSAGDYILRVTDANGCIATRTIAITQPNSPTVVATVSSTNVKCNGGNDGSATAIVSGGKTPYIYLWNNGKTTSSISGLSAGNYTVTVTDATPSSRTLTVAITQPLVNINSITSISQVSIYGGNNGKIVIVSEGGTPAYTYLWLPTNQTTATATGLAAGNQILRVTDANGCIATRTIAITQPAKSSATTDVDQSQDENVLNIFPNPSTGPFNIAISGLQIGNEILVVLRDLLGKEIYSKAFIVSDNTQVITVDNPGSLAPGVYIVIVTGNNNCFQKKIVIQ